MCHRLRREHGEHAIHVFIRSDDLQRLRVTRRIGIAEHIDGVLMAPRSRKEVVEGLQRVLRKLGKRSATKHNGIGGEGTGATRIRDNGKTRPGRQWLLGKHLSHIEKLLDGVHAQHAVLSQRSIEHIIAACHGSGMRSGGTRGLGGAPDFDHDDGLALRDLAGSLQKACGIAADGFHIHHDAFRMWIIAKMTNEIAPTHLRHRASGDEGAKAHVLLVTPIEDGRAKRSALAEKSHAARSGYAGGKSGI